MAVMVGMGEGARSPLTQRLHPVEKRRDVLTAGCCPNGGAGLDNLFSLLRFPTLGLWW